MTSSDAVPLIAVPPSSPMMVAMTGSVPSVTNGDQLLPPKSLRSRDPGNTTGPATGSSNHNAGACYRIEITAHVGRQAFAGSNALASALLSSRTGRGIQERHLDRSLCQRCRQDGVRSRCGPVAALVQDWAYFSDCR